jgi:hypothetical protein
MNQVLKRRTAPKELHLHYHHKLKGTVHARKLVSRHTYRVAMTASMHVMAVASTRSDVLKNSAGYLHAASEGDVLKWQRGVLSEEVLRHTHQHIIAT